MLDFTYKEILWAISIVIIIPQVYVYIKSILDGETKPHIYTKIIWFILTGIWFIIQLENAGWPWAWVMWATCLVQLSTLILALKYWTKDITKFDTSLLILAIICIPIYLWIGNKIYALVFIIFIDFFWYIPTLRKTFKAPESESLLAWNISTLKYIISLFALLEYSFYTMAYPIFLIIANLILIWIMIIRRKILTRKC